MSPYPTARPFHNYPRFSVHNYSNIQHTIPVIRYVSIQQQEDLELSNMNIQFTILVIHYVFINIMSHKIYDGTKRQIN